MVGIDYNAAMNTFGSRLRIARNAKGLTQQEVADHLDINRVNVSTWENDETKPEAGRVPAIAQLLGISETWLFSGQGDAPTATPRAKKKRPRVDLVSGTDLLGSGKMPVFSAAMGGDGHVIVSFEAVDHVKRPAELENVKGGYGLLITGESMVPAFWPGDMALVNPHLQPATKKNVILYHTPPHGGDVEAMIKQLNGWNDKEWLLQQYNPLRKFKEYRQEWPICHRVVGRYDAR